MSDLVIYAISDLHGRLPDIPSDAGALLIAGDVCPDFRQGDHYNHWSSIDTGGAQQSRWLDTTFRAWLEKTHAPVYAIWGNHDFVGEHPELVPDLPWNLLQDSTATCIDERGNPHFTVHGTPWVPGLPRWAFYGTDRQLEARADAIPQCDILMSHGPPFGAGDYIPGGTDKQANKYGNFHGLSVGDQALTDRLQDLYKPVPKVVVCGHIHEARGWHLLPRCQVDIVNVAAVDEDYELHENPWTRIYL